MLIFFNYLFSLIGLIFLSPLFLLIAVLIKIDSKGPILYKQLRVGKNNIDFTLFKFRTMKVDSDKNILLTIGEKDSRITEVGYYLRKYKVDELPQLINILMGNMNFVGPRPEVRKYANFYNEEQKKILTVKPGITDIASICYKNENELLKKVKNPEEYYITEIMPDKIRLNLLYMKEKSFLKDIKVIFKTLKAIIS